jgi:hypothetical protein
MIADLTMEPLSTPQHHGSEPRTSARGSRSLWNPKGLASENRGGIQVSGEQHLELGGNGDGCN